MAPLRERDILLNTIMHPSRPDVLDIARHRFLLHAAIPSTVHATTYDYSCQRCLAWANGQYVYADSEQQQVIFRLTMCEVRTCIAPREGEAPSLENYAI